MLLWQYRGELSDDIGCSSIRTIRLPKGFERSAQFGGKDFRLLPGEVAAFANLVEVNQLGVRALRPAPWSRVDLVWKNSDRLTG
jgi:hypothetical protein